MFCPQSTSTINKLYLKKKKKKPEKKRKPGKKKKRLDGPMLMVARLLDFA